MNILINENQLEFLEKYTFYKELIFKYWDKNGAKIGDHFFHLFDLKNMGLFESNVYSLLTEYRGREKSIEIAKNLLTDTHSIGFDGFKCGNYNYDFIVVNSNITNQKSPIHEQLIMEIAVLVSSKDATVTLIETGEELSLIDALGDGVIGWVVEGEVKECIYDYFHEKITKRVGIAVEINTMEITEFI